jgi:hypothetical protein
MIDVAELVKEPFVGNYFAPDAYIQGDIESGLIESRRGSRLLALPEPLLEGIYAALENELGQGSGLVLFNCGRWWGKNFYRRFAEDVQEYYGKSLAKMEMVEFLQCLKQCWKTHGWGILNVDLDYYYQGFLVVEVWNSAFIKAAPSGNSPMGFAEAGILSAFFSQLTGRDLHCVQTSCESMGAVSNHFIIGLSERIKPAQAWLEEEQDHDTIMERLCRSQASTTQK